MRISDWSSDVCSSDLAEGGAARNAEGNVVHRRQQRAPLALQQAVQQRRRDVEDLREILDFDQRQRHFLPCDRLPFSHVGARRRERASRSSEEHTSELQSLMRISYAVFCLNNKNTY